ncbi:14079_t:CDS:10, partial [Entrophospora sp. SA101]
SETQNNVIKGKGKSKVVATDPATSLLENVNRAKEIWKADLMIFKEILEESLPKEYESSLDVSSYEEEYGGYNISYNDLPTTYYYDILNDISQNYKNNYFLIENDIECKNSYDESWLLNESDKHVSFFMKDINNSITPKKLTKDIFTILKSNKNDDEIQNELVDLIGLENFDFITKLMTDRAKIVKNIGNLETIKKSMGVNELQKKLSACPSTEFNQPYQPSQANENDSDTILDFTAKELCTIRENELRNAKDLLPLPRQQFNKSSESFKHIYGKTHSGTVLSAFGTKYTLPVSSTKHDFKDYEEIIVPITEQAKPLKEENLIELDELDNLCRYSFKGYKSLNRVQSLVYPVAYKKNDNLLICAPTGAGKTDIAILTILRTIHDYCSPVPSMSPEPQTFDISKSDFKIVYIAPMKALAAEIVKKFSSRLAWLDIQVKEFTGDVQLTKIEIANTQIIVTTPEKWDVVTRKGTGDVELSQKVRLLIIDEVHLLHDYRGAVLECLVARTRRQVESSQSMIRIIGLSATLPNYVDVAKFLGVDLNNGAEGLFYFDSGFRPVPLEQHFIGVKGKPGTTISNDNLNKVCWSKVLDTVKEGHQVMVFVHSRKDTVKTAQLFREFATSQGYTDLFDNTSHPHHSFVLKEVMKSKSKELRELFGISFGIHHAGMLRSDRSITEKLFLDGHIKVLFCTATLAWGVNLPAYTVIIKGTQVYDSARGAFVDLPILDVMQIFGRAGRPNLETMGVGYILTTTDKISHYLSSLTEQFPIESRFISQIEDNLNAEISLGTVTNIDEGVRWLGFTYLFVRMKKNPLVYGMNYEEAFEDQELGKRRRDLIENAAKVLQRHEMITYHEETGYFSINDVGRTASNFYISYQTIEIFNQILRERMSEHEIISLICESNEFKDLKSREEEAPELDKLLLSGLPHQIKQTPDSTLGKVNILLQSYMSRIPIESFSLISDSHFVVQNASRIVRALFEIALNRNWSHVTSILLELSKCINKKMWTDETPLLQFGLPQDIIRKLESNKYRPSIEKMRDMQPKELGELVRDHRMGTIIAKCVDQFPILKIDTHIAPITRSILRITLSITPDFVWNDRIHGTVEPWWILVEDSENVELYHSEYFLLSRKQNGETQKLGFNILVNEPLPPQIFIKIVSDRWVGAKVIHPLTLSNVKLPQNNHKQTPLLNLPPLPVTELKNKVLEEICLKRFSHFNPVQTQVFNVLYKTPNNVLIGAPTGSGKTVTAELAMRAFHEMPNSKVVYIAPLKALVRERVDDWQARLTIPMKRRLVELTGDITPDLHSIEKSDIIITTPEKWDGISRSWKYRSYVQDVSLIIIDEIHLLGGGRGPILEVIVSRMNYIGSKTGKKVRIVGLSTALANAQDLADWLEIKEEGLFNFSHQVRPVPLEIEIVGFSGKHYCPRMATMNKPAFQAIMTHSPSKPVIIFVSSRRQTRLTAQDLIAHCCTTEKPYHFLRMPEEEIQAIMLEVNDESLKTSLEFGVGLHHAGLTEGDRKIVEELFLHQKIQVLVATSTLAWGVNLPAHLVIIKGTEFYDAKSKGYVDFPITDVLQMMGRAGRPQFDTSGTACIFVQDSKKDFYKKFLYEPFPVESSLHLQHEDHFNAEIVSGSIKCLQDAIIYLKCTYLYRRLQQNPSYYNLSGDSSVEIDTFLFQLFKDAVDKLKVSGKIASQYYLSHKTINIFHDKLKNNCTVKDILSILCNSEEYSELPVRHNEDLQNQELEKELPWSVDVDHQYDNPHAKAFLLLQAHLVRTKLPMADYLTDTLSVLDQAIRILQAMITFCEGKNFLATCLNVTTVIQCLKQACWPDYSSLLTLPAITKNMLSSILNEKGHVINCLGELTNISEDVEYLIEKSNDSIIANEEFTFIVSLIRTNNNSNYDGKVYAPHFPKQQYESWYLLIGEPSTDKIVSMKRINNMRNDVSGDRHKVQMKLTAPEKEGKYIYTIFLISDGYMGIDQQYNVEITVKSTF